jgi:RNA polymerase sigma factor (sigma-70 family)
VFASVRHWIRKLARSYAARKGWPQLVDDLDAHLSLQVWRKLVQGKFDPSRAGPTMFVFQVARNQLPLGLALATHLVRVPTHAGRGGSHALAIAAEIARRPTMPLGVDTTGEGSGFDLPDPHPGPVEQAIEQFDASIQSSQLRELLGQLSEREQDILDRYCLRGETLREIAGSHGVSHKRIHQIKNEAIRRLARLARAGGAA